MKFSTVKNEKGFWSALFIVFLGTIVSLGTATYYAARTEGVNAVNQVDVMKADYAATGGAYYGIARVNNDALGNGQSESIELGDADVTISAVRMVYAATGDSAIQLTVMAGVKNTSKTIQIILTDPNRLGDHCMWAKEGIDNVAPLDTFYNEDPHLMEQGDDVPDIDEQSLYDESTAQGHDKTGASYTAVDKYPAESFYFAANRPNVTHVFGNLILNGKLTLWGIWVVDGNITFNGSVQLHGVIYCPYASSMIIHGSGSTDASVSGGVFTNGNISGTGSHCDVQYRKSWVEQFAKFQVNPDDSSKVLQRWIYTES